MFPLEHPGERTQHTLVGCRGSGSGRALSRHSSRAGDAPQSWEAIAWIAFCGDCGLGYLYGHFLYGQITNEMDLLFVWTKSVRTNNKLGNDRLLAYPTHVRSGSPRTSSHCVGQLGCWRAWGILLELHVNAPRHSRTEVRYKRPADVGLALHGSLTFCFDGESPPSASLSATPPRSARAF